MDRSEVNMREWVKFKNVEIFKICHVNISLTIILIVLFVTLLYYFKSIVSEMLT